MSKNNGQILFWVIIGILFLLLFGIGCGCGYGVKSSYRESMSEVIPTTCAKNAFSLKNRYSRRIKNEMLPPENATPIEIGNWEVPVETQPQVPSLLSLCNELTLTPKTKENFRENCGCGGMISSYPSPSSDSFVENYENLSCCGGCGGNAGDAPFVFSPSPSLKEPFIENYADGANPCGGCGVCCGCGGGSDLPFVCTPSPTKEPFKENLCGHQIRNGGETVDFANSCQNSDSDESYLKKYDGNLSDKEKLSKMSDKEEEILHEKVKKFRKKLRKFKKDVKKTYR